MTAPALWLLTAASLCPLDYRVVWVWNVHLQEEVRLDSYHEVSRAADLRLEGVSCRDVFDYCRSLADLGCGLYPNAGPPSHVHVDVRSRATIWIDLSGYNDSPRYVADPATWIR